MDIPEYIDDRTYINFTIKIKLSNMLPITKLKNNILPPIVTRYLLNQLRHRKETIMEKSIREVLKKDL